MKRTQFETLSESQFEDFFADNEPVYYDSLSKNLRNSHANVPHVAIYRLDDGFVVLGQDRRAGVGTTGLEFREFAQTLEEADMIARNHGFAIRGS